MRCGLFVIGITMLLLAVGGCGSQTSTPSPDKSPGGAAGDDKSALGFDSPDAVLDAYGKSLVDGNDAAYRKIAAKNSKAIQGLDAILQFEKDKSPEEAAKINLQAMAPIQGFGTAVAKRFPVEVNGDNAVIVQVFERQMGLKTETHFRKFTFAKSGGKWYLVGSEFGEASTLPAKYAWNNEGQPKVVESSPPAPMPITHKAEVVENEKEKVVGGNESGGGESRPDVSASREVELFNGEDLTGWTYLPMKNSKHRGNQSWFADKERKVLFSVAGDWNELATAESYRDFELKLQWRWRPGSEVSPNGSGVVVRVDGRNAEGTNPQGLEIDLRPHEDKEIGLSSGTFIAYDVSFENHRGTADGVKNRILGWRREPGPIVDGQWNDLHIACIEDRVTVTLNDVVVNEGWKLSAREGKITLRNQNAGVEFRNIRLTKVQPGSDVGAKKEPDSPTDAPTEAPKATTYRPPPKDHPEFRDLAVESHDCRIFFPGKPEFTEQNVKITDGNVHVATFQGKTRRATYLFEIYTYSKAFVTKTGVEALLKQTRDNLVDAPTGRLISSMPTTYLDTDALDFVYEHPDTTGAGKGYCRLVMRDNRVCVLEVDGAEIPPAEIAVFHDSLAPFALATSGSAPLPKTVDKPKLPIPDEDSRAAALKLVGEVYKNKFDEAKTAEAKSALAAAMIEDSAAIDAPAQRFVMLDVARKIAVALPEVATTFRAIDRLDAEFQIESVALKIQSLSELNKSRVAADERMAFVDRLVEVAEQAIATDAFQESIELLTLAQTHSRQAREFELVRRITERLKEAKELTSDFSSLEPSLKTLHDNPTDPAASLMVGRFRCFAQGNWHVGLTLLGQSSDERLKMLAQADLAAPTAGKEQIAVGDQWWDLASEHDDLFQKQIRQRAAHWYRLAHASATGLEKQKLDSRLEQISPLP